MSFWDFLSNPQTLNAIGSGLQVGGQIAGALGSLDLGKQTVQAAGFQADQMRQQAGQSQAVAQREAYFADLNSKYVQSAALAAAAASGGGASDPTVINNIAQIAQMGAYKQQIALYSGEERARMLEMQADATEYEGSNRKAASRGAAMGQVLGAGSTLLKGYARESSLLERFGTGRPGEVGT